MVYVKIACIAIFVKKYPEKFKKVSGFNTTHNSFLGMIDKIQLKKLQNITHLYLSPMQWALFLKHIFALHII